MVDIYPIISINILVNDLNTSVKRKRFPNWIKKWDPTSCCLKETNFKYKDTYRLKIKEWRTICHANTNQRKVGVAILISDRADFRARKVFR